MAFYFKFEGIDVKCDTLDELREAIGQHPRAITEVTSRNEDKPRKKLAAARRAMGSGPARSWAMAAWRVAQTRGPLSGAAIEDQRKANKVQREDNGVAWKKLEAKYNDFATALAAEHGQAELSRGELDAYINNLRKEDGVEFQKLVKRLARAKK